MADLDIDGWSERTGDDQDGTALVGYEYAAAAATFVVAVVERSAPDGYQLRLSTINPASNHVRHDYPVKQYETRADAIDGAASFVEHFTARLDEGTVSADDPRIEDIQRTIDSFTDRHLFPSVHRLTRLLRR